MKSPLFLRSNRKAGGQNQAEFAAAFTVLIVLVFVPLINLAAIPMRTGLVQAIVKDTAKGLSLSERFSEADKLLKSGAMEQRLTAVGGVQPTSVQVALRISQVADTSKVIVVDKVKSVPKMWLPDGANAPVNVQLVLKVQSDISPFILATGIPAKIPGLTAPFSTSIEETAAWENLGRDPSTGEFYLNE